jgi:hypothetical protein
MTWQKLPVVLTLTGLAMVATPWVMMVPLHVLERLSYWLAEATFEILAVALYHSYISLYLGGILLFGIGLFAAVAQALWRLFLAGSDARH